MIDLIGDIHGHADELEALLQKMGYVRKHGVYSHPERKVLFVGDYIDRGPKIREALAIVKGMVDSGNAVALMGNHEYNALCFHFQETEGGHLRKHLIKNIIQHYKTLKQFQNRQDEYEMYLDWFKTLPLYYETENFRAVHACWDYDNIDFLRKTLVNDRLTDDLIYESVKKGTRLYEAIDETLKGKELAMPNGLSFTDKDGTIRDHIRIKWWENPANQTFKSISVIPIESLPAQPLSNSVTPDSYYLEDDRPVFFGHYWLRGTPSPNRMNVCCLDYSVAKEGSLVAYRFDHESELKQDKLTYLSASIKLPINLYVFKPK